MPFPSCPYAAIRICDSLICSVVSPTTDLAMPDSTSSSSPGAVDWSDSGPRRIDPPTGEVLDPRVARLLGWAAHGVVLTICVAALPTVAQGYPTSDGVSYMSLAEHWANGRFGLALNGFWSPLLPLLLAPCALLGLPLLLSAQLVMIATGLFAISRLKALMRVVGFDTLADDFLVIGAAPLIAYASISLITPDLLMAALLMGYLTTMLDRSMMSPTRRGLVAGLWAGGAFLAKSYALPFVIAHLVISLLVRTIRRADLRPRFAFSGVAAASLILVVSAWAIPLSVSYGRPTVATTAAYHVEITEQGAPGNAFLWAGLLPPSNGFAISAWEDPAALPTSRTSGSAVDAGVGDDGTAPSAVADRLRRVGGSLRVTLVAGGLMGLTALFGTVSMLWWLVSRRPRRPVREAAPDPFVDIVLAVAVYVGGLSLLVVETRYLWLPLMLTVPCAAWGIRRVLLNAPLVPARILAGVIAAASIAGPAVGISRVLDKASQQRETLALLDEWVDSGDRLASSRSALSLAPGLCEANGCTYWGAANSSTADDLGDRLDALGIDVFLRFGDDPFDAAAAELVLSSPERQLRVYEIAPSSAD